MEIYNASDTSKKVTCEGLPKVNGGSETFTTSGGTVTVTAGGTNWGYIFGSGYAAWKGTGYDFSPPNVWGYGYAFTGSAILEYTCTWTSPAGWPEGGYVIKLNIYAASSALTKTFTELSSEFTLSAAAVAAGEPTAAGSYVVTPGTVNVAAVTTSAGVFTQDVTAKSPDNKVKLDIDQNTVGKTQAGAAITEISLTEMADPPDPPADTSRIGLTYDLGPDDATFDPPITLTFTYDPDEVPEGSDLVISMWDEDADPPQWVDLEGCTVDTTTHTISAPVSHFTPFTVIAQAAPVAPEVTEEPEEPTVAPAAFSLSNLTVRPSEVEPGETVTISASVANTGGEEGSYTVTLKINGVKEADKILTVDAGSSALAEFSVSREDSGSYSVDVDGLSASFTVTAPPVVVPPVTPEIPEEPAPTTNWGLIIGIIAAVIVIGLIAWWIIRRR